MPPTLTYCTIEQFTDRSTYSVDDVDLLTKVMARAERQVDGLLTGFGPNLPNGLAVEPLVDLEPEQADALVDAIVAQTEYRLTMGEEFFRTNEPQSVSGPDFSRSGRLGKIADETLNALRRGRLITQYATGSTVRR
jgi:hypothetical protein